MQLQKILQAYNLNIADCLVVPFGNGLINHTWKVSQDNNKNYLLQRLNTSIFTEPVNVASNIRNIANHLTRHYPGYLFIHPIKTTTGEEMFVDENNGYYRLFPFLENSRSYDVVNTPQQAYEAARQFALFTKLLTDFEADKLHTTIPDFHNLTLRYNQFKEAVINGNPQRIQQATALIHFLKKHEEFIRIFESIKTHPQFKLRVMHHDTKISNVLFNPENVGLCVIDLDTVMPGYYISDVGDMMRTYLSSANEEERDFDKIDVRIEFFEAIYRGYFSEMEEVLTQAEKLLFLYSGKFMIYMQALRFLTDHLNNDVYYGAKYEGHNFVRAQNQVVLLKRLLEKEEELNIILNN